MTRMINRKPDIESQLRRKYVEAKTRNHFEDVKLQRACRALDQRAVESLSAHARQTKHLVVEAKSCARTSGWSAEALLPGDDEGGHENPNKTAKKVKDGMAPLQANVTPWSYFGRFSIESWYEGSHGHPKSRSRPFTAEEPVISSARSSPQNKSRSASLHLKRSQTPKLMLDRCDSQEDQFTDQDSSRRVTSSCSPPRPLRRHSSLSSSGGGRGRVFRRPSTQVKLQGYISMADFTKLSMMAKTKPNTEDSGSDNDEVEGSDELKSLPPVPRSSVPTINNDSLRNRVTGEPDKDSGTSLSRRQTVDLSCIRSDPAHHTGAMEENGKVHLGGLGADVEGVHENPDGVVHKDTVPRNASTLNVHLERQRTSSSMSGTNHTISGDDKSMSMISMAYPRDQHVTRESLAPASRQPRQNNRPAGRKNRLYIRPQDRYRYHHLNQMRRYLLVQSSLGDEAGAPPTGDAVTGHVAFARSARQRALDDMVEENETARPVQTRKASNGELQGRIDSFLASVSQFNRGNPKS